MVFKLWDEEDKRSFLGVWVSIKIKGVGLRFLLGFGREQGRISFINLGLRYTYMGVHVKRQISYCVKYLKISGKCLDLWYFT